MNDKKNTATNLENNSTSQKKGELSFKNFNSFERVCFIISGIVFLLFIIYIICFFANILPRNLHAVFYINAVMCFFMSLAIVRQVKRAGIMGFLTSLALIIIAALNIV